VRCVQYRDAAFVVATWKDVADKSRAVDVDNHRARVGLVKRDDVGCRGEAAAAQDRANSSPVRLISRLE